MCVTLRRCEICLCINSWTHVLYALACRMPHATCSAINPLPHLHTPTDQTVVVVAVELPAIFSLRCKCVYMCMCASVWHIDYFCVVDATTTKTNKTQIIQVQHTIDK